MIQPLRFVLRAPLFRRLSWQVAAVTLVLLLTALGAFGALAYHVASRDLEAELGKRLVNAARLSALQLQSQPLPTSVPGPEEARRLRARLGRLAGLGQLERLLLLDLDGRVLGDSLGQAEGADPYVYLALDEDEWLAAQLGQAQATTLFAGSGGRYFKSAFAPLLGAGGKPLYILRAEASAGFLDDLRQFGVSLALVGLLSLAVAGILALLLSGPLVRPLQALITASRRVAGGDFSARVPSGRSDELGQLTGTFNEMAERLGGFVKQRERLAALGEVAAGMAHEIRNPLAAMEGFAGLAEARLKGKDPETLAHVRDVRREVAVVNGFINDFLEYARPRPPKLVACDLAAVADEAASVALTARQRARWNLRRQGLRQLPALCDPGHVRQVLVNLLKNAREASPKGGILDLGVEQSQSEARLWVRDRGRGIDADQLGSLFQPFVTTKPMGTGLGLSLALKLAEGLGGRIEVQSTPGKGSTFTLVLPLRD